MPIALSFLHQPARLAWKMNNNPTIGRLAKTSACNNWQPGFSLTEVVVSLLLLSSISLALLKQQWQLQRWTIHTYQTAQTSLQQTNARERAGLYQQTGFHLVELLVAIFLAMGITTLLLEQYIQIKRHSQLLEAMVEKTSRQQWVYHFMRTAVHQAGFTPCLPVNRLLSLDRRNQRSLQAITWEPSGILRLAGMDSSFIAVHNIRNQQELYLPFKPAWSHPVIIADCYHAEVQDGYELLRISHGAMMRLTKPLAYTYHPPIYLGEWLERSFMVRPNRTQQPSLFYDAEHPQELLADVQQISVAITPNLVHIDLYIEPEHVTPLDIRLRNL